MPRDIPVETKIVGLFRPKLLHPELYFPMWGRRTHVYGKFCRLGFGWTTILLGWTGWQLDLQYLPDTLVTEVRLYNQELEVSLVCHDAIDFHEDIYLREINVENLSPQQREIRLFFSLDLGIAGNDLGDTAGFDPKTGGVVHYKGTRYFLAGGGFIESYGLSQYAVGQKGVNGKEGTFKDAEDGLLSGNPIAQGSVDSVIGVRLTLEGGAQGKAYFWVVAGQTWEDVLSLDSLVKHKLPQNIIKRTADFGGCGSQRILSSAPGSEKVAQLYRRSLLIIRTQVDSRASFWRRMTRM
jgi:GH15 family glucan-1,4-alpha-glucosidase